MKYAKHLQNVSKEYEILVTKQQRIHLRASILTCFWALEPVRGRPGDHPGLGTLKITKKSLFRSLLWDHICDICWYFWGDKFYMISKPPSCWLFAPIGTHKTQFRRLLATKFGTDWANLEKWKQWFRARGSIKIKLQRASFSHLFHDLYTCPFWRGFFLSFLPILQNCDDLGLHSGSLLGPFWHHFDYRFSDDFFIKLFKSKRNPGEATQGTSQVREEPRGTLEAPRAPRRPEVVLEEKSAKNIVFLNIWARDLLFRLNFGGVT